MLPLAVSVGARASGYVETAQTWVAQLPENTVLRPDLEQALLELANSYRHKQGKSPLQETQALQLAARAHARDMLANNFMGHRSSTGQDFESRMRSFAGRVLRLPRMAENAAKETSKGLDDNEKINRLFAQWVKSGTHRKALLNSGFNVVSTGVVQRGDKIYAVQIFSASAGGVVY